MVSIETKLALRQHVNVAREVIKIPSERKTTFSKAIWVVKSTISSFDSASCEAKIVSITRISQLFTELSLACSVRLRLKYFVLTVRLL